MQKEGGTLILAMTRVHAGRTGGHVCGHAALPSSGNLFWVLLCTLHSAPAVNWKCQTKICLKVCSASCTLGRPSLRVQVFGPTICRRYFALVITFISLLCPASSKFLVYIKHLESEAKILMLNFHHRKYVFQPVLTFGLVMPPECFSIPVI